MYIVVVGNVITDTFKTFKQAHRACVEQMKTVRGNIPVYIAKLIVKDGVVIDK